MIRVAAGLTLPDSVVGEATAILAKRGAGKTNTAKVIVEGAIDLGVQVVVLDPVGVWWGLRSLFPIPVIGGMYGDITLDAHAGRLLADVVVDSGQSMVIDVSTLDSDGAMQRLAYEFAEQLYKRKQAAPSSLLLVLEEADEFAPQDTRGANVPRMVGAFARIVKRGRSRGLGVLSVTQRSAALSKNVLDQSDSLIVMRTVGPRDRDAIAGWVKHQDAEGMDQVLPSLPTLKTGEAWFWSPGHDGKQLVKTKVAKARSLDTSASPTVGGRVPTGKMKPVDLLALDRRIAETAERAKENDPAALKKKISDLERRLSIAVAEKVEAATAAVTAVERVEVEVPVLLAADIAQLIDVRESLEHDIENMESSLAAATLLVERVAAAIDATWPPPPSAPAPAPAVAATPARDVGAIRVPIAQSEGPRAKILDGLRWLHAAGVIAPTRIQVGFVSGYRVSKKGGGRFANLLGELRGAGMIEYPDNGRVSLTNAGLNAAAEPTIGATDQDFHGHVYAQLPDPEARILAALVDIYPDEISRVDLGARTGYNVTEKGGGRFANLLGRLRSLDMIDYPRSGQVRATPTMFPFGSR